VVAQNGHDRRLEALDRSDQRGDLVRLSVTREIAREQHEISLAGGVGEHRGQALVPRATGVHVSCGGNFDHFLLCSTEPLPG
jgi:hypothetical protein